MQPVAENLFVHHIHGIHEKFQLFGVDVRLQNIAESVQNIRQTAGFFFQLDLSAFNAAHIQHIIDQV